MKYRLRPNANSTGFDFWVEGDLGTVAKDVEFSSDIAGCGKRLKIGGNIESLKLRENDTVDLTSAYNLKSVDITESKKYFVKEGVLYEKIGGDQGYAEKVSTYGNKKIDIIVGKAIYPENEVHNNKEKLNAIYKDINDKKKKFDEWFNSLSLSRNSDEVKKIVSKLQEIDNAYNQIKNSTTDENINQFEVLKNQFVGMMENFYKKVNEEADKERLDAISKDINDEKEKFDE